MKKLIIVSTVAHGKDSTALNLISGFILSIFAYGLVKHGAF